jgi:catechol-2,3-dioxygenase
MDTRIAVVSLWAEDVPTAVHFYQDIIGLRLLPHTHERPHFDVDGVYLTILKGRPVSAQDAAPERFPLIALALDDLEAAEQRLRRHGVELPWGIETDANSSWVMFHDPAGNLVELVQFL